MPALVVRGEVHKASAAKPVMVMGATVAAQGLILAGAAVANMLLYALKVCARHKAEAVLAETEPVQVWRDT